MVKKEDKNAIKIKFKVDHGENAEELLKNINFE